LKKDSKVDNKKSSFPIIRYKDISEIDRKVDRILLENKNKLNNVELEELDVKKFSPKNKDGKTIYYIREKSKKNTEDDKDSKILSEEIISDINKKSEAEFPKTNENVEKTDEKPKKGKRRIVFGKKEEKQVKKEEPKEEKPVKSGEYKEMISGIDKLIEGKKPVSSYKETPPPETIKADEGTVKNKDTERPSHPPDLSEFRKKYEAHLTLSDLDSVETAEKVEHEPKMDDKIAETTPPEEIKVDIVDRQKEEIEKTTEKKSFFKRKKKTSKVEEVKEKGFKELTGKSDFRVENLAEKVDEKKDDTAEDEAVELTKEELHVTDDEIGKTYTAGDAEHVFFDETDTSFDGWSPKVTEEEKEKASLPLSAKPEVESEGFKRDEIKWPEEMLRTTSIKPTELGFSEDEWEELDFYPLREPFAYVEILREKESLDKRYFLVEIDLTAEEKRTLEFILDTIHRLTIDTMDLETKGDDRYLMGRVEQVIKDYDVKLDDVSKGKILYYIEKRALGLDKIDPLMKDPNIEDISCDGANVPIFLYHRQYGSLKSNIEFKDEEELSSFVVRLAQKCGKHISIAEPMLDATMPDGSRVQMTLSDEVTAKGSTFTIRKFREDPFSPPDLVEFNTMSSEIIAYMWLAVENGINALIAGGTASGKTTVLNALSLFIPMEAKIVSIEETREINLPHPNWIPGVSRSGFGEIVADKMVGEIDMYDLMKAALRQRPEYILVGEIRGREAYVLFQAMATGHATYSTVHADSPQSLIHRLEGKPINIPRVMLQSLDIVSLHVITRVKDKRARRCKQVIEIIDIDPTTKEILTNEVFRWDPVEDKFVYSGKSYVLERIRAEKDLSREEMTDEIKNRKKIVEWMNTKNIREFREVAKIIAQYTEEPDGVLKQIGKDVS